MKKGVSLLFQGMCFIISEEKNVKNDSNFGAIP